MKKWWYTIRPNQSETVRKLIALGKGRDIMNAIQIEMRSGKGHGTYNGIRVERVGRIIID